MINRHITVGLAMITSTALGGAVVQFENLDKLQALYNSAPYKDAIAVGDKYSTQRIFGVEGISP